MEEQIKKMGQETAGERKRGEWDRKIESSGYKDRRSVTEKKKRHIGKGERCLSKLGLTWHFGHILIFISPKWPSNCLVTPLVFVPFYFTRFFFFFYHFSRRLARFCTVWVFTSVGSRIRGAQAGAPPRVSCPSSFPLQLHLLLPLPLIPLINCKKKIIVNGAISHFQINCVRETSSFYLTPAVPLFLKTKSSLWRFWPHVGWLWSCFSQSGTPFYRCTFLPMVSHHSSDPLVVVTCQDMQQCASTGREEDEGCKLVNMDVNHAWFKILEVETLSLFLTLYYDWKL